MGGALIAIALVLIAVFVPAGLITGISGQFYKQFALTIAAATVISLTVSLTLSPALCVLVLRPHGAAHAHGRGWRGVLASFGERFTAAFDRAEPLLFTRHHPAGAHPGPVMSWCLRACCWR